MKTEQQLLDLKKNVDEAKTSVAELTGQQKSLMKQLKDDWQCSTIEAAQMKLKSMDNDIANLDAKIAKGTKELEEKYNV
jgi:predicted nuclease with TOPRIM domain